MTKIRKAFDGLIASRKGILALLGLITVQVFLLITLGLIIAEWILKPNLISFEFVKDIFVGGFQVTAAIITAYSAANISSHYIAKKRDENHKKRT